MMSNFNDFITKVYHIASQLPDDDPDKDEILNNEADFNEWIEWAVDKRNYSLAQAEGCKTLISQYKARIERFEKKASYMAKLCSIALDAANKRKYVGSAGTVGFKALPQSVVVTDEAKVPDQFKVTKTTISIDKKALKDALKNGEVEGASLSNGGESLQFRIK
jgi:hypothetical protein